MQPASAYDDRLAESEDIQQKAADVICHTPVLFSLSRAACGTASVRRCDATFVGRDFSKKDQRF
ncbi:MAG: hypothetical protein AVDCRST_MAG42-1261 [uncultured Chthoniobacterales bacterium]|uniref:Uncharacterized protein n=1 Tax=uncultured Chthoniobacterales bacterium TaxID=1836801 RepID=A0A6J4HWE0_9BACT|nr:MAG: hypothetical protein AVDCRST_MAG42-1261 [uncultured Chthoniobacterales bacterium]